MPVRSRGSARERSAGDRSGRAGAPPKATTKTAEDKDCEEGRQERERLKTAALAVGSRKGRLMAAFPLLASHFVRLRFVRHWRDSISQDGHRDRPDRRARQPRARIPATRHNAGFWFVDVLAREHGGAVRQRAQAQGRDGRDSDRGTPSAAAEADDLHELERRVGPGAPSSYYKIAGRARAGRARRARSARRARALKFDGGGAAATTACAD